MKSTKAALVIIQALCPGPATPVRDLPGSVLLTYASNAAIRSSDVGAAGAGAAASAWTKVNKPNSAKIPDIFKLRVRCWNCIFIVGGVTCGYCDRAALMHDPGWIGRLARPMPTTPLTTVTAGDPR